MVMEDQMATLKEKKAKILSLLDSHRAVARGLVSIYERQTLDEQSSLSTTHDNGRGFTAFDAEFGSSLAKAVLSGKSLSEKQVLYGRRLVKKYWRQLIEVADVRRPGWADPPPVDPPAQPATVAVVPSAQAPKPTSPYASLGF